MTDAKARRFRYGVQVNSLGLTEAQPENNVQRIVLEMLAVTLSKDARARAIQLPAWNEALGLPRPWDQQWSLRMQQVLAFESDLLEYDDLFTGSVVVERKVAELVAGARAEMARIEEMGGAVAAVESGYMKSALVASHAERRRRIESGEAVIVGLNRFETTEPNPLTADLDTAIQTVDPAVEQAAADAVRAWREQRDADPARRARAAAALERLRGDAASGANLMSASLECARAEVTTGEWAEALRERVRRVPRADGRLGLRRRRLGRARRGAGPGPGRWLARVRSSARSCASSSASPASTATATAPSRWPSAPATPASRWSTRASA